MTEVRRINLSTVSSLEVDIQNICTNMSVDGFRLASSFVFQTQLVLIFQR